MTTITDVMAHLLWLHRQYGDIECVSYSDGMPDMNPEPTTDKLYKGPGTRVSLDGFSSAASPSDEEIEDCLAEIEQLVDGGDQ